jgi:hypothetical protein
MNIENLSQTEIKTLHTLFGKLLEEPQQKIPTDPLSKMIEEIMEEFDFDKVYKAMDALDWKWRGQIPSIEDLEKEAERLLRGAAKSRLGDFKRSHWELGIINGTGGFQATAFCDRTKTRITGLDLKFVVSEWDEGDNEE